MFALSAFALLGCSADLIPVQPVGPRLHFELEGLAGRVRALAVVESEGSKIVAAGGEQDAPVLLTRVDASWLDTPVPEGWRAPIRALAALPGGQTLIAGEDSSLALGLLGRFATLPPPIAGRRLSAVASEREGRFWIAGDGLIWRHEADALSEIPFVDNASTAGQLVLTAIAAHAEGDLTAVGAGGVILRGGAAGFHLERNADGQDLRALAGAPSTPLYAVGGSTVAVVLRREGTRWRALATPPDWPPLFGATMSNDGILWLVGDAGFLGRFDGSSLERVELGHPELRFDAVLVDGAQVYLGGAQSSAPADAKTGLIARYGR